MQSRISPFFFLTDTSCESVPGLCFSLSSRSSARCVVSDKVKVSASDPVFLVEDEVRVRLF